MAKTAMATIRFSQRDCSAANTILCVRSDSCTAVTAGLGGDFNVFDIVAAVVF